MVKTSDFESENSGSSPDNATNEIRLLREALYEACDIALGTDLHRQATERIKELQAKGLPRCP